MVCLGLPEDYGQMRNKWLIDAADAYIFQKFTANEDAEQGWESRNTVSPLPLVIGSPPVSLRSGIGVLETVGLLHRGRLAILVLRHPNEMAVDVDHVVALASSVHSSLHDGWHAVPQQAEVHDADLAQIQLLKVVAAESWNRER